MIRFTAVNSNKNVYINAKNITAIYTLADCITIYFDKENCVSVKESEDEVVAKLYGAELDSYTRIGTFSRL
jgi:uncharacterized protein YlzI (FlbEa/FlbD family)